MKVKIKETYLILLIVISLISLGVYSTYALFTASTTIDDVVGISATLDIGKSISEYEIVSVDAGDTKLIELNVVNSSSNTIYYGAWYKIVEGNSEDIEIGLYTAVNSNSSSGTLAASSSTNLLVGITNNSDTTITVYLGVKGSISNELNLSNDKTILPTGWSQEYTVTLTVVNGTTDVSSVTVNGGSSASFNVTTTRPYFIDNNSKNCGGSLNSSTGVYTISNITGNKNCTLTFGLPQTSYQVLRYLGFSVTYTSNNFSVTNCSSGCTETTAGVGQAHDGQGLSYYFRGSVENNYVKFAGFYWRIIRINGDGSIRMIYDGTSAHTNGESSSDRVYSSGIINSSSNDNTYVGYMYGTASASTYALTHSNSTNSIIKNSLTGFFTTNIANTEYVQYVKDAIYCNDRSVYSGTGIGTTTTYYGAYNRLYTNKSPTLTCLQTNDSFTVNTMAGGVGGNKGNIYPIGLITADEVVMAGGSANDTIAGNTKFYLYCGQNYFTMTPALYSGSARVYAVNSNLTSISVSTGLSVRPVISISSSAILYGTGTATNPFRLTESI